MMTLILALAMLFNAMPFYWQVLLAVFLIEAVVLIVSYKLPTHSGTGNAWPDDHPEFNAPHDKPK